LLLRRHQRRHFAALNITFWLPGKTRVSPAMILNGAQGGVRVPP
jgi:hypothetical protein